MFPLLRLLNVSIRRHYSSPTIYALSTHLARSAIGVVRVSGSQCGHIYQTLTKKSQLPKPRVATVRKLYQPQLGVLLDEALLLYFSGPKSYTGEDLLELHLHGGTAIIRSVLSAIKSLHCPDQGISIRYAENGEFSKKAFLNKRLDLTQIEGIREMIDAETESQRVAALLLLLGGTKTMFEQWRSEIVHNIALLTTVIDFGEDHDVDEVELLFQQVDDRIHSLANKIREYLYKVRKSEVLLKGIKLVLLGPPNAGKSLLLNHLANTDAAIVSNIAGTTRDIIDVPIDINGYKVVVGDTAGIREVGNADLIEMEGIRRAKLKSLGSDLVLIVLPAEIQSTLDYKDLLQHIMELRENNKDIKLILNKQDLLQGAVEEITQFYAEKLQLDSTDIHLVSCETGFGLEELGNALVGSFKKISLSESTDPVIVSSRIQDLLENDVLEGFREFSKYKEIDDVVLATESLRQSVEGIGKITGDAIGVEEILSVVFSSFCIGK